MREMFHLFNRWESDPDLYEVGSWKWAHRPLPLYGEWPKGANTPMAITRRDWSLVETPPPSLPHPRIWHITAPASEDVGAECLGGIKGTTHESYQALVKPLPRVTPEVAARRFHESAVFTESPHLTLQDTYSHLKLPVTQVLWPKSYYLSFTLLRVTMQTLETNALSLTSDTSKISEILPLRLGYDRSVDGFSRELGTMELLGHAAATDNRYS